MGNLRSPLPGKVTCAPCPGIRTQACLEVTLFRSTVGLPLPLFPGCRGCLLVGASSCSPGASVASSFLCSSTAWSLPRPPRHLLLPVFPVGFCRTVSGFPVGVDSGGRFPFPVATAEFWADHTVLFWRCGHLLPVF